MLNRVLLSLYFFLACFIASNYAERCIDDMQDCESDIIDLTLFDRVVESQRYVGPPSDIVCNIENPGLVRGYCRDDGDVVFELDLEGMDLGPSYSIFGALPLSGSGSYTYDPNDPLSGSGSYNMPFTYVIPNGVNGNNNTITIRDDADNSCEISIEIEEPNECNCPIDIGLHLEGALINEGFGTYAEQMRATINDFKLLPGQPGLTGFSKPTPAGLPYKAAPWNYQGTDGDTITVYPQSVVDWILVDIRTGLDASTNICRQGAWLYEDGRVVFPDNQCNCSLDNVNQVRVAIHHRNHLPMISPTVVVDNGRVAFDFRYEDSQSGFAGKGQKQIDDERFVMYGGNCDTGTESNYADINAIDITSWRSTSVSDTLVAQDLDMTTDVNSNDKILLIRNNGVFGVITN